MKLYKSILISIVIIMLSSCGSTTISTEQISLPTPNIGVDVQNQKYLEVKAPDGWNSFKTERSVSLLIRNVSDTPIIADPDFGARIFIRADNEWREIKNKTVYLNESSFTLDPNKNFDFTKTVSFVVLPDLPDYSVPSEIRIFVVGSLIEDGKESKSVASYIDLRLNP